MKQIAPFPLWIGPGTPETDIRAVFDAGIRAVVDVALEILPAVLPRELIYCRIPMLDSIGNDSDVLFLATRTLASLIERHIPTLIRCGAGVSRAPALAAAALFLVHGETPERWLQRVVEYCPCDVSPGLWNEIVHFLSTMPKG